MKFLFLAIFVITLQSSKSFAVDRWQAIGGNKLSYLLPSRLEPQSDETKNQIKQESEDARKNSFQACSSSATVLYSVFEKLIMNNNLQPFVEVGPGIGLIIFCEKTEIRFFDTKGPAANYAFINIPQYVVANAEYEDEVAIVLAHEISHILLEHNYLYRQLLKQLDIEPIALRMGLIAPPAEVEAFVAKTEAEADMLGVLLIINAGYNPKYFRSSLDKLFGGKGMQALGLVFGTFFDDGHGTNYEREQKIKSFLQYTHLPDTPGITNPQPKEAKTTLEHSNRK